MAELQTLRTLERHFSTAKDELASASIVNGKNSAPPVFNIAILDKLKAHHVITALWSLFNPAYKFGDDAHATNLAYTVRLAQEASFYFASLLEQHGWVAKYGDDLNRALEIEQRFMGLVTSIDELAKSHDDASRAEKVASLREKVRAQALDDLPAFHACLCGTAEAAEGANGSDGAGRGLYVAWAEKKYLRFRDGDYDAVQYAKHLDAFAVTVLHLQWLCESGLLFLLTMQTKSSQA